MNILEIIGLCTCLTSGLWLVAFIMFILKADGDLTLLYYEKYGKKLDALKDKVIWITGASSGIGECLAYDLSSSKAKLALSGTDIAQLQEVKNHCIALGVKEENVIIVDFDITNFEIHDECVKKVIDHFGHIDILVNNAGRSQRADFENIETEIDQLIFNVNVFGCVSLTRKVLKHFLERRSGHIVVTSSMAGKMGAPNSASYTGSKHALQGYFECLRTEMSSKGIDVTIICPGPVFSKIVERAFTETTGKSTGMAHESTNKRMATNRCSQLMAIAIANKLDEAWICFQPLLLIYYLAQYMPTTFHTIMKKLYSKERASAMREGRN